MLNRRNNMILFYGLLVLVSLQTYGMSKLFIPALSDTLKNAIKNNDINTLKKLFEKKEITPNSYVNYPQPLLFYAVQENCTKMAAFLLDHGADFRTTYYGHTILEKPMKDLNVKMVRTLLSHGVPPDLHVPGKESSLFLAVRKQYLPMVSLLLERGANPACCNKLYDTPISVADCLYNQKLNEFRRLLAIRPLYEDMHDRSSNAVERMNKDTAESEQIIDTLVRHFSWHQAQRWLNESALFQSLRKKYYPQE